MVDWQDSSPGGLQKGFDKVQKTAKEARGSYEYKSSYGGGEKKPLLTHIAPEAGMGGLMYELPAGKLFSAVRSAEKSVYEAFDKKGVKTSEPLSSASERAKTPAEVAFMSFCQSHREGHLAGLKRVDQKALLGAILTNAEKQSDMNPQDLAMQVATTFEVAGEDENTKTELRQMLTESSTWKTRVVDIQATKDMKIAGISDSENTLFPGATRFEMPAKEPTSLDPLYEKWSNFVAASTEKRANAFIEKSKTDKVAQDITVAVQAL